MEKSKEFFNKGSVSKSWGFKRGTFIPMTIVMIAHMQAFLEIYKVFQIHQLEGRNNTPREYTNHLPRESMPFKPSP